MKTDLLTFLPRRGGGAELVPRFGMFIQSVVEEGDDEFSVSVYIFLVTDIC